MRAYSLWFLLDTHNGAIGDFVGCRPISWGNIGSLGKYLKIHSVVHILILLKRQLKNDYGMQLMSVVWVLFASNILPQKMCPFKGWQIVYFGLWLRLMSKMSNGNTFY